MLKHIKNKISTNLYILKENNTSMVKISVSILSEDFAQDAVDEIETADMLHYDIMDGEYAGEKTIWAEAVEHLQTNLEKDVHLMIQNPEEYIDEFADAGADRISFHIEATEVPEAVIGMIQSKRIKAGIAMEPETSIADILKFIEDIDFILVMSVKAGMGGQRFKPEVLEKVKRLKSQNPALEIEIDGGITAENARQIKDAGVDVIVSGTFVFSDEPSKQIKILREA